MARFKLLVSFVIGLSSTFAIGLKAEREIPQGAGPLVIVGGAAGLALEEIMSEVMALKQPGKPLGIFNSGQPDSTAMASGQRFTDDINAMFGEGTAVYIHITESNNAGDDPEVADQILACGGVFFLGGSQTSVMRSFFHDNGRGEPRAAFDALWQIFSEGAVVSGSSAGAAIMSDPMISGGTSSNALLRGATPAGAASPGVSYRKGMGFVPGVLFCQHHLERGRFGRLLAGVVDPVFESHLGIGIAEGTAVVVDHSTRMARVIGAKGVLVINPREVELGERGEMTDVSVHLLDRGDQIHLDTLDIIFAEGKEAWTPTQPYEEIQVGAWGTDALYDLIVRLGDTQNAEYGVAADTNFDITFSRTPETRVYRLPDEPTEMRPTWAVTDLDVTVLRRDEQVSLYLHDWRFEDVEGTELSAALNSARPWVTWNGNWDDSVTTGDGVFRIRRDGTGLNRRVDVGETNDAELLYMLVRFAGWNLSNVVNEASGQVALRFHFMNGPAADNPGQITAGFMLTLDDDGTFLLRADASGTAAPGGVTSEDVSMFPNVLEEPLSILVTYDTIRHEYAVDYRFGDEDWQQFFAATTSGVRSAESMRMWVRGDFDGEGVNFLDLDRFAVLTFHPDEELDEEGDSVSIWDEQEAVTETGIKETSFGLLWDVHWPWVYHYGRNDWLYCRVIDNYEDSGFHFHRLSTMEWYWVTAETNVWVFRFDDPGSWIAW